MLFSTQTSQLEKRFGAKNAIKMIHDAGFDAFDFSFFSLDEKNELFGDSYIDYAKELREYADSTGIVCNQAHAPFPSGLYGDEQLNSKQLPRILKAIEASAVLGAKAIIVHPIHHLPDSVNINEYNAEFYKKLLPTAEKCGIIICTENMWQRDPRRSKCIIDSTNSKACDFASMIDYINSPYLRGCLDLGHCELVGEAPDKAIRGMGNKRIIALHIHDNDRYGDNHTLPYLSSLEWDKILSALKETEYEGDFTYEADGFLCGFPDELVFDALCFMYKVGRHMMSKIIG